MTDPSELPATFFSATRANPTPPELPKPNGAFTWGLVGWLLFVIALVALGFVVWLA